MKKNYIAPSTETATLASMGLMDGIGFATNSVSGGGTEYSTFNNGDEIV